MDNKKLIILLRYAAISGNFIFILWILFNAMDEGFSGNMVEKCSAAGLISLLAVNSGLLINRSPQQQLSKQQTGN